MNTDISGIGVRISFYLQTLFLGQSVDSITSFSKLMHFLYRNAGGSIRLEGRY